MSTRVAYEIERDCIELGSEGRLIKLQLEELIGELPGEKAALVHDYHALGGAAADEALERLESLSFVELLQPEFLLQLLAYRRRVNPLDHHVEPRGYRVLSHIPRLPSRCHAQDRDRVRRAWTRSWTPPRRELQAVEGIGPSRAREIREGLRRLKEHDLG